jgi:hypothetical protein
LAARVIWVLVTRLAGRREQEAASVVSEASCGLLACGPPVGSSVEVLVFWSLAPPTVRGLVLREGLEAVGGRCRGALRGASGLLRSSPPPLGGWLRASGEGCRERLGTAIVCGPCDGNPKSVRRMEQAYEGFGRSKPLRA